MFRNFDWECRSCGFIHEKIIEFPQGTNAPRSCALQCSDCEAETEHERLISIPAEYHGEKMLNPVVYGGRFDTAGNCELPPLPDVPKHEQSNPDAWRDTLKSKEFQEAKRERAVIKQQNAAKRKRLREIKQGKNINMRRDRLPGDPKLTS